MCLHYDATFFYLKYTTSVVSALQLSLNCHRFTFQVWLIRSPVRSYVQASRIFVHEQLYSYFY